VASHFLKFPLTEWLTKGLGMSMCQDRLRYGEGTRRDLP